MSGKSREKKPTLQKLDTAFYFTFTIITLSISFMNLVLGNLTGVMRTLFPLTIIFLAAYTYYVGIWHGIVKDKVPSRFFA